ncbi:hypothetical protein BH24PSE2_BH24PSE2_04140 [soil metagenome]
MTCRPGTRRRYTILPILSLAVLIALAADAESSPREAAQDAVRAHIEAGQYEEAVDVAAHSLREIEREVGEESVELVDPLLDLAQAHALAGEFAASERSYNRAISLIEAADGSYDRRLIAPLSGRGDLYLAQRRHDEAIESFQRARHIWHRVDGINTLEQLEVLNRLADSFLGAGKLLEANRAKIRAFRIAEHHYGRATLEMVPAIRELADWYLKTGQYPGAVMLYQRALRALERETGEDDPRLIPVLNGLATARGAEGYRLREAERALERVLSITERQPGAGIAGRVQALVILADWRIQTSKARSAQELYRRAWDLLASDPAFGEELDSLFGRPVALRYPPMPAYVPIPPVPFREIDFSRLRERYVDLAFTVKADGHVADVDITDADAPAAQIYQVRQRLYEAIYRPRLVDGEPVDTRIQLRQTIPPTRLYR